MYSEQYLKNSLSDLIQIWHVDATAYQGDLKLPLVRYLNSIYVFFISGQYLKNDLMDSIKIWHVAVTSFEGVPYFKVTLKSHV